MTEKKQEFSLLKIIPTVLTVALGMLLVMMDTTVMNIALPTLQKSFNVSLDSAQWTITAYTFAIAAVTPISGWLSDWLTAKVAFGGAIALFVITSLMCSLAPSINWLITFRILQGVAGGIVGPVGMALSWQVVPQEKRGSLMGLLGLPIVVAPIAGPLLCGYLLEVATWHSIFLINLPFGLLAFLMVLKFIPKSDPVKKETLDWKGMLLAPAGFLGILYGIHRLSSHALTDPTTAICLVGGVILVIAFYLNEKSQPHPLMAVKAFSSGKFMRGISVSWLNQIVYFGGTLLLTLFLQTAKGFSPLHAGEMLAPQAVASFVGMIIGGRLFDKWGVRAAALPGVSLMAIATGLLSQVTIKTSIAQMVMMIIILGLGQGMMMMQISTYNLSVAPKSMVTRVTPMINAAMQLVNSLAIVLLTNILSTNVEKTMRNVHQVMNIKPQLVLAYGKTFLVPFFILIISGLLITTLKAEKKA